jgi:hypothetical protein
MKRLFLIGLVAALLAGGCVTHEQSCDPVSRQQALIPPPELATAPPSTVCPGTVCQPVMPASAPKNEATEELVKLLSETESVDTFLVALEALAALDPNYTKAVPVAIKNAERLELLAGIAGSDKKTKEQQAFTGLVKVFVDAKKGPVFTPAPPGTVPTELNRAMVPPQGIPASRLVPGQPIPPQHWPPPIAPSAYPPGIPTAVPAGLMPPPPVAPAPPHPQTSY